MRKLLTALAMVSALAIAAPLRADTMPWDADQALLKQVQSAMQSQGILGLEPLAPQIEKALANAQLTYVIGDTQYLLTDGVGEAMIAMTIVQTGKGEKPAKAVAIDNPYPLLGLYLGSYYDEAGKFEDALRVLDLALTKHAVEGIDIGETRPSLLTERGEALMALKRFDEALKDFDEILQDNDVDSRLRAHALRGKGYVFTELGRLDDAEAAYWESLKLEPGNETAKHELEYIGGLKNGKAATTGVLAPLQKPAPANDSPGH